MSLKPKESILKIQPYKAGLSKAKGLESVIKLSSNESPFGASSKAVEAYKQAADNLHRYPESSGLELREAIGEVYGLNPQKIVCGAGSDEIISFLCLAYAGEGDEVLYSEHGFLMYAIYAQTVGATPVKVPETGLATDVDAILSAVTDRTKIVFVANPNNPTGSFIPREEVGRLRGGLPDDVLLVLDAAYAEYVDDDEYMSGQDVVDFGSNTVMTRTFSKIYGLASLRIGWAYCPDAVVDVLNRVRGPFNISSAAIAAATAAVRDVEFVEKARQHNNTELKWLETEINQLGLEFCKSFGNFYMVKFPDREKSSHNAYKFLMEKGIITRKIDNYGLPEYLRITVGLKEDNQAVVKVLAEFVK